MSSSKSPLPPRQFPLFLLFSLLAFFSLCSAEIRFSSIRSDWRSIIPFDEFGFTHKGLLELNVSKIVLSDLPQPDPDLSKVGFFLCTRDSWIHVFQQLKEGEIRCALDSTLVKPVYTFKSLNGGDRFSTVFSETDVDQYTLIFANCLQPLKVSMDVKLAAYNLEGRKNDRRDYLSADKEKKVLMIVIPLQVIANIAQVVIDKTMPFGHDWVTWKQMFLLVDVVCYCAVLFPIVWSIKNLREAARTDGKAAVNLMKWTLFRQYYIYFTRVVVYALETITPYWYLWTNVVATELATLAFYVFTEYKFKPEVHNPYFVIDDDEEEAAAK